MSILSAWPVIVFGAPGALLGLAVCVAGALRRSPALLVAGGIVLAPSSFYLGGHFWPLFGLPVFPWVAALWVRRLGRIRTLLFLVPNVTVVALLLFVTIKNIWWPGALEQIAAPDTALRFS